ncbi:MAG: cysteine desulfurase family protein, partial [Dehalococcoidia bacterium]
MPDLIYLDHAATTPIDPRVLDAMLPWLSGRFGNPSALYRLGRDAQQAIETARQQVAACLNARPSEIIFTSGGSESANAAVRGLLLAAQLARTANHIVTTTIEHHAVLHTCEYLERFGVEVTYVPPDDEGRISAESIIQSVRPDTGIVSLMLANNEVGTLQPVAEVARLVQERGRSLGRRIPVYTDAVQAPGWLSLDVRALGVDALSLSAHKFGGPKGAGVLYLRRGIPFLAQQTGGGQERQRRAGTENVAGIVGTGLALHIAEAAREEASPRVRVLRDQLEASILARVPRTSRNGHPTARLPNNVNIAFHGVKGDVLVEELDRLDLAASAGSACATMTWEPSHVLMAMGQTQEQAASAVRFSLGPEHTSTTLHDAVERIERAVRVVRANAGMAPSMALPG